MLDTQIIMYGTTWCPDCARSKRVFNKLNIDFKWIDIEKDEQARACVIQVNHGLRSVPTIVFPDGSILVEPNDIDLEKKLSHIK
jgi:mycoredoxin